MLEQLRMVLTASIAVSCDGDVATDDEARSGRWTQRQGVSSEVLFNFSADPYGAGWRGLSVDCLQLCFVRLP
jgi:hypothetical protein